MQLILERQIPGNPEKKGTSIIHLPEGYFLDIDQITGVVQIDLRGKQAKYSIYPNPQSPQEPIVMGIWVSSDDLQKEVCLYLSPEKVLEREQPQQVPEV